MNRLTLVCAVVSGLLLAGCIQRTSATIYPGSGVVREEERQVGEFTGVELAGMGDVLYEAGPAYTVLVSAEDNFLDLGFVKTQVQGDILYCSIELPRNASITPTQPIRFFVTAPTLTAASVTGSGDFQSDRVEGERLHVEITGSGDLQLDTVATDALEVHISGSGNVNLPAVTCEQVIGAIAGSGDLTMAGTATRQDYRITGAGDIDAAGLSGASGLVTIAGSGDARVNVTETLDVKIAGSGEVRYSASPRVTTDITGSGEVRPAD